MRILTYIHAHIYIEAELLRRGGQQEEDIDLAAVMQFLQDTQEVSLYIYIYIYACVCIYINIYNHMYEYIYIKCL